MRDEVFLLGRILFSLALLGSAYGHLTQTEASAGYAQYKGIPNAKAMVRLTGVLMGLGGADAVPHLVTSLACVPSDAGVRASASLPQPRASRR